MAGKNYSQQRASGKRYRTGGLGVGQEPLFQRNKKARRLTYAGSVF